MENTANGGDRAQLDITLDFLAGTIAGMASLVVGFPLDTVKVRFQSPTIAGKYHSTWNALGTIIREERFIGLYKGITSPLVVSGASVAFINGLVFASYRFFMKIQLGHSDAVPTLYQIALAGTGSGIISSLITTPTELIKIRQQSLFIQTTAQQVTWQIFREGGIRGLYRGFAATALRDAGYGAYFFTYEATCRFLSSPPYVDPVGTLSWPALMFAGGVAGVVGWAITFPFDVVKTRIQASQPIYSTAMPSINENNKASLVSTFKTPLLHKLDIFSAKDLDPYRTTWSTIKHSYRTEGLAVFFHGLSPTLVRAIPANMVTFAAFEAVVKGFS